MNIKFWFIAPLIAFTLLYPSGDESLEECSLIITCIYLIDDLYDPQYFESISIQEALKDAVEIPTQK